VLVNSDIALIGTEMCPKNMTKTLNLTIHTLSLIMML
jgi:hypothetical protein